MLSMPSRSAVPGATMSRARKKSADPVAPPAPVDSSPGSADAIGSDGGRKQKQACFAGKSVWMGRISACQVRRQDWRAGRSAPAAGPVAVGTCPRTLRHRVRGLRSYGATRPRSRYALGLRSVRLLGGLPTRPSVTLRTAERPGLARRPVVGPAPSPARIFAGLCHAAIGVGDVAHLSRQADLSEAGQGLAVDLQGSAGVGGGDRQRDRQVGARARRCARRPRR